MKTRKNKLSNFLKLGVFLFGISLLLWNCNKEDEKILLNEIQQEKTIAHISLEDFKLNINKNSKFEKLSTFFDVNKNHSTNGQKRNTNLSDATLLTSKITRIKKDDFTSYTFRILTQNDDNFIYNLVLYVNNSNEIYKSFILKYIPSQQWELDTSSYFNGKVSLLKNDFFNTNNFTFSRENADCLTGGTTYWECSFGYEHAPGTCNASSYEYIIELEYGECDNGGSGDVNVNPTGPSEGGSSGGGQDGGIVTAPNTIPYTSELKNFVSGTLNAEERNYYTSHSNIRNTVDNYLIQKNFSNFAKFNGKLALEFGNNLSLNPQNFIWVFNNKNSKELQDIKVFLAVNNNSTEAEAFAEQVIKTFAENPDLTNDDIDFEDQIINLLAGKAECVYDKLTESSTDFKNMIKKFDGDFPVSHLKLEMRDLGNTRAVTELPDGNTQNGNNTRDYLITIALNNNSNEHGINYRPNLMNAKTIAHEIIHAEMYRKLLSVLDNGGNIQGVTKQDVLDALDGNFPGMYDYYRRHKNWQHQQMATHYRETIASILQVFDTGIPVPIDSNGNPLISQLYMDIAWEGLIYELGDNAIYTWTSLLQPEKDRIEKVIKDYIEANKNENCQ